MITKPGKDFVESFVDDPAVAWGDDPEHLTAQQIENRALVVIYALEELLRSRTDHETYLKVMQHCSLMQVSSQRFEDWRWSIVCAAKDYREELS